MIKKAICVIVVLSFCGSLHAEPPLPPVGKRWVLNPNLSDEFNGTELDNSKWLDHHPTWRGREPGIFLPSQVSVADGFLQIRGEKLKEEIVVRRGRGHKDVYTIAGGAVVSKNSGHFGYYECRCKAAATTMSTTFWFSGGGGIGPNGCDSYGQEWDIQECVGRRGDFDGKYFASGMHSNGHYWYTDCDGEKHDHRADQVTFEDPGLASAAFHVYGGWWKDATEASYYYDNGPAKHQTFYNKISDTPFDKPMRMNLVSETHPFPWIELPTDEELADPVKSVAVYDWVRGYSLVDFDASYAAEPNPNMATNGGFETGDLDQWKGRGGSRSVVSSPEHVHDGKYAVRLHGAALLSRLVLLKPETDYDYSCYAKVTPGSTFTCVLKSDDTFTAKVTEQQYERKSFRFRTPKSGNIRIEVSSSGEDHEGYFDNFVIRESNPDILEQPPIVDAFQERIEFGGEVIFDDRDNALAVPIIYAANQDRQVRLTLRHGDSVVSQTTIEANAGLANGIVKFVVQEDFSDSGRYALHASLMADGNSDATIGEAVQQITLPTANQ